MQRNFLKPPPPKNNPQKGIPKNNSKKGGAKNTRKKHTEKKQLKKGCKKTTEKAGAENKQKKQPFFFVFLFFFECRKQPKKQVQKTRVQKIGAENKWVQKINTENKYRKSDLCKGTIY